MSGAIDTNLLLYAEDVSSPFHARALTFLNHLFEAGSPVYITWDVFHSFLRIATNPAGFFKTINTQLSCQ